MNIILSILYLILGLIVLIKSATYLFDSVVFIAEKSRVPKIIIGATLVSLITTTPELFVSISATIKGENQIAIANSIGSVIFNTGIILSLAAIFMSGKIDKVNIFEKSAILALSLITLTLFSRDNYIVWYEGTIQFILIIIYAYLNTISINKQNSLIKQNKHYKKQKNIYAQLLIFMLSASIIFLGTMIIIMSSARIISQIRPSDLVISFIYIISSSLPELIITIIAIIKKQQSLAIGIVLGANILNLTFICGFSGIISQIGLRISQTLYTDLLIAYLLFFIFILPMYFAGKIKKWQGYLGISIYLLYLIYLLIIVK